MFRGIQRLLYFVPSPAVAVEWFSRLFDVEVTCLDHPHHCYLRVGEHEIHFQQDDRTLVGLGEHVACWKVDDLDAVVLRALELEALLIRGPLVRPDGTLFALLRTPFKSVIGLTGPAEYVSTEEGGELSLGAYAVRSGWLRRTLQVTGNVQAELEYTARGAVLGVGTVDAPDSGRGHLLRINGKEATAGSPIAGEVIYLPFRLPHEPNALPGRLEVLLQPGWSGLMQIEELRLRIAGTLLYEEKGGNPTMDRSPLPIPAQTTPETQDLPLPAEEREP